MTLVTVTHEMDFARQVSHRAVFMQRGRVRGSGLPARLPGSPQTPGLQQFVQPLPA